MKNIVVIVGLSVFLFGCATPKEMYVPKVQNLSEPPVGTVANANIGDKLLTQGTLVERMAICFPGDQKFYMGSTITKGCFAKSSDDVGFEFYTTSTENGSGRAYDLLGVPLPYGLAVRKSDNAVCPVGVTGNASTMGCKVGLNFEKKNWASSNTDSFQQTLIYNGKVGNKINIAYREFSSNLARPAFNNDVEYDLSQSKQIGYKGALLEVIDANNQSITYKVIKNFN